MDQIHVSDLSEYSHWVPLIAGWHHEEWIKLRHKKRIENKDNYNFRDGENFQDRLKALARHLGKDSIPTTYVAHLGYEPVGTVSLVYYRFTNEQKSSEWLTNLFVLPEYRCNGIASLLLKTAVAQARILKLSRLLLYTNDQVEFYRKRHWCPFRKGIVQGQEVDIMDLDLDKDKVR